MIGHNNYTKMGNHKWSKSQTLKIVYCINPLTPELSPSEQRSLPRFFTVDFKFYCSFLGEKRHIL